MDKMWNKIESDEWSGMTPDDMRSITAMRAALADKSERPAPDALFGECLRLALAHVAAGTEDAPSWTALLSRVRLWLSSKGAAVDDDAVRSKANTFVLAVYAW
jgi:hypothetical protein